LKSYHYPIEETWTTEEIIDVIEFFNLIEKAYESTVNRVDLLESYRQFKKVVPSKSEEKQYFSQFEHSSGYSSFHAVKLARDSENNEISLNSSR